MTFFCLRFCVLALCVVLGTGCKPKQQPAPAIPPHLKTAVVLCFHDVGRSGRYAITVEDFERVLDSLREFKVVSLKDWVDARNPEDIRQRVAITFDDGYTAHREIVLPELISRGFGATFYFYADQLERDAAWRRIAREHPAFDFGSHSWSHALLRDVEYDALFKELYLARNFLESALGRKIESFAWPFGYYDGNGLKAAQHAGFGYQVSVDYRIASRDDIPKIIPRYTVLGKKPVEQVRQILDGYRHPGQAPPGSPRPRK
jgi:peptidoglycan/xylan/chitin deacetylase (PgdA/CDA1 family)